MIFFQLFSSTIQNFMFVFLGLFVRVQPLFCRVLLRGFSQTVHKNEIVVSFKLFSKWLIQFSFTNYILAHASDIWNTQRVSYTLKCPASLLANHYPKWRPLLVDTTSLWNIYIYIKHYIYICVCVCVCVCVRVRVCVCVCACLCVCVVRVKQLLWDRGRIFSLYSSDSALCYIFLFRHTLIFFGSQKYPFTKVLFL